MENKKRYRRIVDFDKVKKQYKAGVSMNQLSIMHDIPYATLYRALNPKVGINNNKQEK